MLKLKTHSGFHDYFLNMHICYRGKTTLHIVAVNFIGGGNRSNWKKALTSHKSLTNFITSCCIEYYHKITIMTAHFDIEVKNSSNMVKKMIVYIVLVLVVFILDVEGKITIHT